MWTEDNLMVSLPEDQQERDGFVLLVESSDTVGGWGWFWCAGRRAQGV